VGAQKQNEICKTKAQNAIALLYYLKRIALRRQVFTKKFERAKNLTATLLNNSF
jgi:hypothetical protein